MSTIVLAEVIACGLAVLLHEPLGDEQAITARAVTAAAAAELCAILPPAQFGIPGERLNSAGRDAAARRRIAREGHDDPLITVVFACWASIAFAEGATKKDVRKGAAPTAPTEVLSKQAFTEKVAQELAAKFPDAKFSVAGELTITRIEADGKNTEVSLENLYRDYNTAPSKLAALLRDFAAAIGEKCSAGCGGKVDRTRIVPLIKDRAWIEGNRRNLKKEQSDLDFVFEDFNDDLVVVYVQDAERRVRFLMSNEDLGVERGALRKLAVENLGRIRPKIEMHSHGNDACDVRCGRYLRGEPCCSRRYGQTGRSRWTEISWWQCRQAMRCW